MIHFNGVKFVPRDLWVGAYIGEREPDAYGCYRSVVVCPLPCIAISFDVRVHRHG